MLPVSDTHATRARLALGRADSAIAALIQWSESEAACAVVRPVLVAWSGLVAALALGPEPPTRACPICARPGMLAATRCGYCWHKLTPLPDLEVKDSTPTANRSSQETR
jgi:hypothetical protein